MTFDLRTILLFAAAALIYSALLPVKRRGWALLIGSVLALYWLQPKPPFIRFSDFVFPTATLMLTVICWWFTLPKDAAAGRAFKRDDLFTFGLIVALVTGIAFTRYLAPELRLTSRPPNPLHIALVLGILGGTIGLLTFIRQKHTRFPLLTALILLIVVLFIVLKTEPLAAGLSRLWRIQTGQNPDLANITDVAGWLGFSYIAFRLIHTLRDRQSGKLPALSLREYVTYIIFFPSIIAGPIDRAERFAKDFRALPEVMGLAAPRLVEGGTRITVGIFKKFVVADSLALGLALNVTNAEQATSAGALWLLIYGYALRLFFDFSGYSDIAIGIGILFGIKLPENFDRPYLKSDIASFWQSWHITLGTWARFYVFTPLSRMLLSRDPKPSSTVIVLTTQIATMTIIGLWHGVTVNFFIWGVWHGLGLFVHKQWSDRTRKWVLSLKGKPLQKRAWTFFGWLLMFHFVVLGWVWFALPEVGQSLRVFAGLFGLT